MKCQGKVKSNSCWYNESKSESDIPDNITDCKLTFLGLIGLADPPENL